MCDTRAACRGKKRPPGFKGQQHVILPESAAGQMVAPAVAAVTAPAGHRNEMMSGWAHLHVDVTQRSRRRAKEKLASKKEKLRN